MKKRKWKFRIAGGAVTLLGIYLMAVGYGETITLTIATVVLIFGIGSYQGMGLMGAAIATVVSQATGAITGLLLLYRRGGYFEVRHEDGSGTKFYDTARYAAPRGDYQVFEDARGSQWYAIQGDAAVDRKPVYENGKPVYDNGKLRTVNTETVRYKQTPARFAEPEKREDIERKPPRRKM